MTDADKAWTTTCIVDFVVGAFTEFWNPVEMGRAAVKDSMAPFMTWLHSSPDHLVAQFCWDLLKYDRTFTPEPFWWLDHSGRLSGDISYDNVRLAISTADEGRAMYWWTDARWKLVSWDRDSRIFFAVEIAPISRLN